MTTAPMVLRSDLVEVSCDKRGWLIRWPKSRSAVRGLSLQAAIAGSEPTEPWAQRAVGTARLDDALGTAEALQSLYAREDVTFEVQARLVPGQSSVLFSLSARNDGPDPVTISSVSLASTAVKVGVYAEPIVYVDSGSQGGTHAAPLGEGQTCAGICALRNPRSEVGLVCAFVSFEHDNQVRVEPAPSALSLQATTTTPIEIAPGAEHQFDPILFDVRRSALEGLEEYASVVKAIVNPPIPATMPMGWLSWYAYRLVMTEDLVLQNADVMARHFLKYGMDLIHPDHGWQYKDICGHWVPNEKFGHGMKWLQRKLSKQGQRLALWVAPSTISEWAPFFTEHPEGLMLDEDGQPKATRDEWPWTPGGKTYELDPLTRAGEQYLRSFGKQMRSYGAVYLKTDFIGGWGGPRRLRHGMRVLREAVGPEITLRPCSTALNTQLGVCNEIGIARDIGNAQSLWPHLQVTSLETASKWFMQGKFWHNNPDVLIVGDEGETLGEAIGRVTLLALTGGVVMLGDKMPELEQQPERLALCSRAIPSSGKAARPIDLLWEGRDYPRLWQLDAKAAWADWQVLGCFNWSAEPPTETIRRADLDLPAGQYLVWDFWRQKLLGKLGKELSIEVGPGTARCLRIMPVPDRPAVLSTDMHVTQGLVELDKVKWNESKLQLSGEAIRAPEEQGAIFVYLPKQFRPATNSKAEMVAPGVAKLNVSFSRPREKWSLRFEAV
ncbi:MAG: hypothetical protein ACM3VW_00890 [Bacteroidota bacterium]